MAISLAKEIRSLDAKLERIESKVEDLNERIAEIQDRAGDADRVLTEREAAMIMKYEDDISELEEEQDEIMSALDYLSEYDF